MRAHFVALISLLSLICAIEGRTAVVHGVERGQQPIYSHVDVNSLANEFQLIDPSSISFDYPDDNRTYWVKPVGDFKQIKNNMVVNVKYYGSHTNVTDWIGAFAPAMTNQSEKVPVKFAMANVDPDYMDSGYGQAQFNFTNLRSDISFSFFTNGLQNPQLRNSTKNDASLYVDFANYNEPLRPRMTPTGDYDVFRLLWSSNNSLNPIVQWGTKKGKYSATVNAETKYITVDDVCSGFESRAAGVGWREQGAIHTANLTGMKDLDAGSFIYYIFGSETDGMSEEYVFTVPPRAGVTMTRPTTAVLYCDLGRGGNDDSETWYAYGRPSINTTESVGALVQKGEVDVVFHGGDISYACGYEAVWDFFLNQLSPVASRVLYFTTVGNHESDWPETSTIYNRTDSGGECGVLNQGHLPMPAPATTDKPWWSYNVGLMHMVGMSTEHDFSECSEQYEFLENDLRTVNRTETPWVIFNGHRAMYVNSNFAAQNKSYSDGAVQTQLILKIEPLLFKYKVNAAFWGHNHVFQRQSAVYNASVVQASEPVTLEGNDVNLYANPSATVQFVLGNAGANFSANAYYGQQRPIWNEVCENFYGYSIIKAYNASYLSWDTIDSNDGPEEIVKDRVVITQNPDDFSIPWTLPDEEPFTGFPPPSIADCNPPPSTDDGPDSTVAGSSGNSMSAATIAGISLTVLAVCGILVWKVYQVMKIGGEGTGGDIIYPAGSGIRNPLIDESTEVKGKDVYTVQSISQ